MKNLSDFLSRYKNFTPPSRVVVRAVCAAAKDILNLTLMETDVRVVHGVAHIQVGGAAKSELLLHRQELLECARRLAGDALRDIR